MIVNTNKIKINAYNWTQTHNHLVGKRTLNHLAKLDIASHIVSVSRKEFLNIHATILCGFKWHDRNINSRKRFLPFWHILHWKGLSELWHNMCLLRWLGAWNLRSQSGHWKRSGRPPYGFPVRIRGLN